MEQPLIWRAWAKMGAKAEAGAKSQQQNRTKRRSGKGLT